MSSPGELITRVSAFVTDLDALLKSDVVEAVMALVKQLGISAAVATALDAIKKGLTKLDGWIAEMVHCSKFLEILSPVLVGLELLDDLLSDGKSLFLETIHKVKDITAVIGEVVDPKRIGALQDSIKRLTGTLETYVTKLDVPKEPARLTGGAK